MPENKVIIGVEADTKKFETQIEYVKNKMFEIDRTLKQVDTKGLEGVDTLKLEADYERLNNRLVELNSQQLKYNQSLQDISNSRLQNVEQQLGKIGNSMEKITKKVVRWGLAVFGVRSIYLGIRQAINTLSQQDKTMEANINYIKFALANVIKPVIEWIIKAVYNIIGFIGRIIYLLTGKNIFKKSGVKEYEKSLKNSNKSAKELKKTIAGFDEMEVLQDKSSKDEGGTPNVPDLSEYVTQGGKFEEITRKLVDGWFDLGEKIHEAMYDSGGLKQAFGYWDTFVQGFLFLVGGIWDILEGALEFIGGFLDVIIGLLTLNWKKVKDGFKIMLHGLVKILEGIAEIMVGVVKTVIGVVKGILGELWSGIKGAASLFYDYVIKPIGDFFMWLWDKIVLGAKGVWNGIVSIFSGFVNFFVGIFSTAWDGIKKLFSQGGQIFNGLKEGIVTSFKAIVNTLISGINKLIAMPFKSINGLLNTLRDISIAGFHPFKFIKKNLLPIPQIPKLAKGGIINMPGSGVPVGYGSAVGGERGREGVIPLTDSQQMALLGEAIGKYITVNATITNTMNGRIISRELQKINNESDFAFNR